MKKIFLILVLSLSCLCITMAQEASFAKPTATAEAMAWFKKGKWKNGFKVKPYDHINVQTFPQDYDFMGNNVQYVCGMSVPPNMMANIAMEVWKQWLGR